MQRDGPNDPENPRNWNALSKTMLSVNVMILTVMTYMGSSIYTLGIAGHNSVMEDFNTSQTLGVCVPAKYKAT
jgi:DHA1 family multidrug resistance protein-like MFS transporter